MLEYMMGVNRLFLDWFPMSLLKLEGGNHWLKDMSPPLCMISRSLVSLAFSAGP